MHPSLAALIGGSVVFGLAGTLLVPAIAGVGALLVLLPWLPVVALLRRAFPGGRGELVLVGLLAFVLVGFTQSFCNRGFYEWKIRNRSVEFQLPAGATFQDRTTGEALPQGAPAAPKR